MKQFKVDAVPYQHEEMDTWRHNFSGVSYLHEEANLLIFGAVDDVWVNPKGELIVVDYKATAKAEPVRALGPDRVFGLILPERDSSDDSAARATILADHLGIRTETVDIAPALEAIGC